MKAQDQNTEVKVITSYNQIK